MRSPCGMKICPDNFKWNILEPNYFHWDNLVIYHSLFTYHQCKTLVKNAISYQEHFPIDTTLDAFFPLLETILYLRGKLP